MFASMKARVFVTLKNGVLDPQGQSDRPRVARPRPSRCRRSAPGKVSTSNSRSVTSEGGAIVKEMCEKLLANTVIEKYEIELDG